jgi:hypothetical protein
MNGAAKSQVLTGLVSWCNRPQFEVCGIAYSIGDLGLKSILSAMFQDIAE